MKWNDVPESLSRAKALHRFGRTLCEVVGGEDPRALWRVVKDFRRFPPSVREVEGWLRGEWLPDEPLYSKLIEHFSKDDLGTPSIDRLEDLYAIAGERRHLVLKEAVADVASQIGALNMTDFADRTLHVRRSVNFSPWSLIPARKIEDMMTVATRLGADESTVQRVRSANLSARHRDRLEFNELHRTLAHRIKSRNLKYPKFGKSLFETGYSRYLHLSKISDVVHGNQIPVEPADFWHFADIALPPHCDPEDGPPLRYLYDQSLHLAAEMRWRDAQTPGEYLKAVRARTGLAQQDVAALLGRTSTSLNQFEHDQKPVGAHVVDDMLSTFDRLEAERRSRYGDCASPWFCGERRVSFASILAPNPGRRSWKQRSHVRRAATPGGAAWTERNLSAYPPRDDGKGR